MIAGNNEAQEKDQAADLIEILYTENYRFVYNLVHKTLGSRYVAEDITQDTFLEALRQAECLADHPSPKAWLAKVAHNKINNYNRQLSRRSGVNLEEYMDYLESPEENYGLAELNLLLDTTLSVRERQLFQSYYARGYAQADLALLEGVSESAIKNRLYRIRQKLLKAMER